MFWHQAGTFKSQGMKRVNPKRIAVGVVVVVVLVAIIAPVMYFTNRPAEMHGTTSSTNAITVALGTVSTNSTATPHDTRPTNRPAEISYFKVPEGERIDCYPESKAGVDIVDKIKCRYGRHCVFDEKSNTTPCYFPREKGYVGKQLDVTEKGFRVHLGRRSYQEGPFPGNIDHLEFEVEEYGDNALRFKVILRVFFHSVAILH